MDLSDIIAAVAILVAIASVTVAVVANVRAQQALELQARIDERDREFRAVEWTMKVDRSADGKDIELDLINSGDSDARSVTLVLHLNPHREVHNLGDIRAKGSRTITSAQFTHWMRAAAAHEVVSPEARVHWSSPLGQVGDEKLRMKTVDDFIVLTEDGPG